MDQPFTYEALVALFGESPKQGNAIALAIEERGGHCQKCGNCNKLSAILPAPFSWHTANQANYSVRVSCNLDPSRIYPHRADNQRAEDCPSLKRHQRLEARQSQSQAA